MGAGLDGAGVHYARHANAAPAAQAGDELAVKVASRLGIDGVIDGIKGHVVLRLVGEPVRKCPLMPNLLCARGGSDRYHHLTPA